MLEIVAQDADYMVDPAPRVVVLALNDYNILIGLRAWIHDERKHGEVRDRTLERINEIFQREGVDMPLETIQLAPFSVLPVPSGDATSERDHRAA